ncbi:MAG: 50S ribosomal protein L29 [Candidatus Heimdallarchaeota archaeon]|nr:50S ribosomal protein L29 [Candidatus Heimdallarchaeota archaeon]
MAILRMKEIKKMSPDQRMANLKKYRAELSEKKAQLSAGGSIDNPGKVSELRKTIARLLTVMNEDNE